MLPINTILHPTDFSMHSDYAFRLACSLARDYNARLLLLHVKAPPVVLYTDGMIPAEPEGYEQEMAERLVRLRDRARGVVVKQRLVEGEPAAEVLRVAREAGCDLVVMGTHGRTGLGRILMGSVAEQVVRKASCPVLTVKTPVADEGGHEQPDEGP